MVLFEAGVVNGREASGKLVMLDTGYSLIH